LFRADGAPGILPFEAFPFRKVSEAFPPRMDPPAVSRTVAPTDESAGRTGTSRLPGFDPSESPSPFALRLTARMAGYSLGLWAFPGLALERLARTPARAPLTCLSNCSSAYCSHPAPQGLIGTRLARSTSARTSRTARPSSPPKVFAPLHPCRLRPRRPGLWVHLADEPPSLTVPTPLFGPSVSPYRSRQA